MKVEFKKLDIEKKEQLRNFIKVNYEFIKILLDFASIDGCILKNKGKVDFDNDDFIEKLIEYIPTKDEYKDYLDAKVDNYISAFNIYYSLFDLSLSTGAIYDFNNCFLKSVTSEVLTKLF